MPLKTKSVTIKTGDRFFITESTIDKSVKAAPLNPKIAAAIRGEALAEESTKKKGKEENKALDKRESERKKKNRKTEQEQKKKSVKENKKLLNEKEKKKA